MSKHYIFSDTHHGSDKVVGFLKKQAHGEKISVSSTGDFAVYQANARGPKTLVHPFTDAYRKEDKDAMKKAEPGWIRKVVVPGTVKSGKKLQELKPILRGGRVNAIMGNSDYGVGGTTKKYSGSGTRELLGGEKSAVNHVSDVQIRREGKTTFVYMPHDERIASRYKKSDYGSTREALQKDKGYQDRLERIANRVNKYNSDNIVVMMHEAPAPERWYGKGSAKSKSRLPDGLKAHYNAVLETILEKNSDKKVDIFHGHLHEAKKKEYEYKVGGQNVQAHLLDIGDVVAYDTDSGKYRRRKAA